MSDGYFSMLNMPDARERRAYALLNAAAVIFAETLDHDNSGMDEHDLAVSAVARAGLLLAEIEKRQYEERLREEAK